MTACPTLIHDIDDQCALETTPTNGQLFFRDVALKLARLNGGDDGDWTYQPVCMETSREDQRNWSVAMFDEENQFVGFLGI